ncbi:16S rRNA pseudouridine(516) synthase RsuA [Marinobacterium jannaschii]|uniref:16S rRNA pseudouridine(516) synthase RsuA n=1 Tax=Marinobacterium jannaschii TaxID=64970 RepID=UPI000B101066|nr:16S rRNA pseudouridine(516) synthase RsuA [Marinobacterium jannaschii]
MALFYLWFRLKMRLDKYLSQSTGFSRKEVKKMLHKGMISVDGEVTKDASLHVAADAHVLMEGYPVEPPGDKYIMLYKPEGFVCSNDDGTHPTVVSLIELPRADELHICGRLDVDTTGLVLLTSNGKWAHRITSPKHKTGKVYRVETADPIPQEAIEQFETGLMLASERFRTKPARLEILSEHEALVTLTEGRYHQVKRMFAAIGNRVVGLHRESVGAIELDEMLEPGEYRFLSDAEVESVQ